MRFAMICTFYPPYNFGGDGIFVQRLSNALGAAGHRVDVVHCKDAYRTLARKEPSAQVENHPNVTVHGLESGVGALSPLATQQTGLPLFKGKIREILEQGFDVIHFHNPSLIGGPGVLEMGSGIKLYTLHEYWLVCPTHVLFKNQAYACDKPECLPCILRHRRPPQLWRLTPMLDSAVKHIDAFIAPSRFVRDKHREMGFGERIEVLPHFVPQADGSVGQIESSIPYFLFVGRLEKLKGLHTLIPVFKEYKRAELWIAGTGEDESALRELAGGIENVRFLGYQAGDALGRLYAGAQAVIIPSITYDVAPQVGYEAYTHRTPVIGRRIGGIPELIEDSGGGYVYEDERQLIGIMDALLDTGHRNKLGERGYAFYQRELTAETHLARYFELIECL